MSEVHAPAGFGPVLATARAIPESRRVLSIVTLVTFSVLVAVFEKCRGLDWWWSAGTGAAIFGCLYAANFKVYLRAGDGWFASNNAFVRTDRLTEVRARILVPSGVHVELWDAGGRYIDVPLSELTNDPQIWQLVVAGVSVSRAAGLTVGDNLSARIFGLPKRSEKAPHTHAAF